MTLKFSKIMEMLNPSTKITYDKVVEVHEKSPKRICLKTCHSNALRTTNFDNSDVKWALFIPFDESIKKIFEEETDLQIYKTSSGRYWCPIKNEDDYKIANDFKSKYDAIVFLRDNLDLSISLSEHFDDNENRTEIGELEYQAKYQNCNESLDKLIVLIVDFIRNTPVYKDADCICAIPSSNPDDINLPTQIAKKLADEHDFTNISENIRWKEKKEPLKTLSLSEKWNELEKTDIEINTDLKNKSVILLDDLYQSGTTIQFVAMKLKDAGVKKVYGLTVVKSRRDTDNK